MAIEKNSTVFWRKEVRTFVDRVDPRSAFWERLDYMRREGTTIINFHGAGGLGKTGLATKLLKEFTEKSPRETKNFSDIVYLFHDFMNGLDMRTILRHWKKSLSAAGCVFPLFETGEFYFQLKTNKDVTAEIFSSSARFAVIGELRPVITAVFKPHEFASFIPKPSRQ